MKRIAIFIFRKQFIEFSKWYNENQWRGGEGDYLKSLFCKCKYDKIVKHYETTKTLTNE